MSQQDIVVDASALVEYLVELQHTVPATRLFRRLSSEPDLCMWVPDLAYVEVTSVLSRLVRAKTISRLVFGDGIPLNNYSDLWWGGASQNGWGLSITQQGSTMFGVWYNYDALGKVQWLFMPGGSFTSANIFSGALYRTTSSPWLGAAYNPALLNISPVGNLTLTFSDANNASMRYTVDGVSGTNALTRLVFGSSAR